MKAVVFSTPLGWAGIASTKDGISRVVLPGKSRGSAGRELEEAGAEGEGAAGPATRTAARLLRRYFSGERVSFDLPLDVQHYTPFQQAVWRAAAEIPYGETRSYGWIAKRIGRPRAMRAVGQALGANPVPVIIP